MLHITCWLLTSPRGELVYINEWWFVQDDGVGQSGCPLRASIAAMIECPAASAISRGVSHSSIRVRNSGFAPPSRSVWTATGIALSDGHVERRVVIDHALIRVRAKRKQ
jgi:hypothetical protein